MKRKIIISIVTIILSMLQYSTIQEPSSNTGFKSYETTKFLPGSISQDSKKDAEELYQDIFITLLNPVINNSIKKQYGGWVPYDIWDIKVLNAERINSGRTIGFILKIEVMPYQGAHNSIGIDHLTIRILCDREPEVIKFEHIKSF